MSDLVERLRRAFDADSVAEKNLAIRAAYDFIAAMQTDAAPALKPAVEVWQEASDAATDGSVKYQSHADQAAAAVIEADRAAIIAAKDAEIAALKGQLAQQAEDNADLPTIAYLAGAADARDHLAALQAHADALAAVLRHRGGPLCPARYYGDEQCTCGVSDALRAYEESRRG